MTPLATRLDVVLVTGRAPGKLHESLHQTSCQLARAAAADTSGRFRVEPAATVQTGYSVAYGACCHEVKP